MIPGFETRDFEVNGVTIHAAIGGSGPPLLLLHGYPQTHICWRKLAPDLARTHCVVIPDLRGYGASSKPQGAADHSNYSKREMAADQVALMKALGHERFLVFGHDRGGRVAHRMALDYVNEVEKVAVLDIAPTARMYADTDKTFATIYYHWFFLIQPYDLPERLIGADVDYYLRRGFGGGGSNHEIFGQEAIDAYVASFKTPNGVHGPCEDYRAAASIDLEHDAADENRKVEAPMLVLWGERGFVGHRYDVLAIWREKAHRVSGQAIACGHFLPEEAPQETLAALRAFLAA